LRVADHAIQPDFFWLTKMLAQVHNEGEVTAITGQELDGIELVAQKES